MNKDKLLIRIKEIQTQDKAAAKSEHANEYTIGYIDGHLHAFNAIEKLVKQLDKS